MCFLHLLNITNILHSFSSYRIMFYISLLLVFNKKTVFYKSIYKKDFLL